MKEKMLILFDILIIVFLGLEGWLTSQGIIPLFLFVISLIVLFPVWIMMLCLSMMAHSDKGDFPFIGY